MGEIKKIIKPEPKGEPIISSLKDSIFSKQEYWDNRNKQLDQFIEDQIKHEPQNASKHPDSP